MPAIAIKRQVEVRFCDGTTDIREYENGSWGRLSATQHYAEMLQSGEDHSILNVAPHVIGVHIDLDGATATEEFVCRCQESMRASA